MTQTPGLAPAPAYELKSQRFRRQREDQWRRLESILRRAERGGPRALSDAELVEAPVLYRQTLSALSVARETALDAALIAYLESLSARAYFFVYGARVSLAERVQTFFARDWPASVRGLWKETLVAGLVMLLGAVVAAVLVQSHPDWFYSFVPGDLAGGRDPTASAETLRATLYDAPEEGGLSAFAAFLFTHNAGVAIFAFALGFAFGAPSLILMAYNGATLGAFVMLFVSRGLGLELGGWLLIHGVTELFAVTLAGAAGVRIGMAVAFPGDRSRLDAATDAGRSAGLVMAGVVIMLMLAGLLEGFGRQLITLDWVRYAIAAVTALVWGLYFYAPRRRLREVRA